MTETSVNLLPQPFMECHVLEAGNADCLLIKTPAGRWGLIDCGLSTPNPKLRNPPQLLATTVTLKRRLAEQNITKLAFVQLTHPETDHARGMYEILKDFEVEVFCGLPQLLARKSLARLRGLIIERQNEGRLKVIVPSPGAVIWQEAAPDFIVLTLGPGVRDKLAFKLAIVKKLGLEASSLENEDDLTTLVQSIEAQNGPAPYNRLSIITLGQYGKARLLLGADALAFSWRDLARSSNYANPATRPLAQVFKVPHHGASDGMPLELVDVFLSAAAAPLISSSGHSFSSPAKEVLAGFTDANRPPYCTGRSVWCPGQHPGRPCGGLVTSSQTSDNSIDITTQYQERQRLPVMCRS